MILGTRVESDWLPRFLMGFFLQGFKGGRILVFVAFYFSFLFYLEFIFLFLFYMAGNGERESGFGW